MQEIKNIGERKTVRRTKGEQYMIFACRRLQFDVEAATKTFAQCKALGAIDSIAEWSVHNKVHRSGFIKESLEHDARLRWHGTKRACSRD